MRKMNKRIAIIAVIALALNFAMAIPKSQAASLTSVSDTVSTMKAGTAANHTIVFTTPTGVTAGQTITLTFDATYDVTTTAGVVVGDVTATSTSGTFTVTSVTGQVITITEATVVSAGATITVKVGTNAGGTHQIKNGAAGTNKIIAIAGTFADSGKIATAFITNDVVSVDANVDPTLTFAINNNTLHFGTLSTTTSTWATTAAGPIVAKSSGHTMTVGTNATSGYTITYSGQGLKSGANEITAMGAGGAAPVNGTAQFGIGFTTAGSATIPAAYNSTNYGYVNTGAATQIASLATPVASEIISAYYIANISSATPAGSYSTAITYIATGNF